MTTTYTKSVDALFVLVTLTLAVLYFYLADLVGGGVQYYQPLDIAIAGMWVFIIATLFITFTNSLFEDDTTESVSSLVVSSITGQALVTGIRTALVVGFAYITGVTESIQELQLLAVLVFGISFLIALDEELQELRDATSTFKNVYKPTIRQYIIGTNTVAKDTDGDLIDGVTGEEIDTDDYSLGRLSSIVAVLSRWVGKRGLLVGFIATLVLFVLSVMMVLSIAIPSNVYTEVLAVVLGSFGVGIVGLLLLYIVLFNSSNVISGRAMLGTIVLMAVETLVSIRYHLGVVVGLWVATPFTNSAIAVVFVFWVLTVMSLFGASDGTRGETGDVETAE